LGSEEDSHLELLHAQRIRLSYFLQKATSLSTFSRFAGKACILLWHWQSFRFVTRRLHFLNYFISFFWNYWRVRC
jgi:hypothetical protein